MLPFCILLPLLFSIPSTIFALESCFQFQRGGYTTLCRSYEIISCLLQLLLCVFDPNQCTLVSHFLLLCECKELFSLIAFVEQRRNRFYFCGSYSWSSEARCMARATGRKHSVNINQKMSHFYLREFVYKFVVVM